MTEVEGRPRWVLMPLLLLGAALMASAIYGSISPRPPYTSAAQWGWLAGLAVALGIAAFGFFLRARRLTLDSSALTCRSWLGVRQIVPAAVTDISFEQETPSGSEGYDHTFHYVVLYGRDGKLIRFNIDYWEPTQLKALLRELIRMQPRINVDREVKDYLRN